MDHFVAAAQKVTSLDSTGHKFVDVDECETSNLYGNGTCSNLNGGFECSCGPGYAPGPEGDFEE